MEGSVHPDVIWAVSQAAQRELGDSARDLFRDIDLSARVPMARALRMWQALAEADDDGTLGARLGRHQLQHGGVLSTLLSAAGAQSTLARGMRVLSRYWALISSHAELLVEFHDDDGERVFRLQSAYGAGARPTVVSQSTLYVLLDGIREICECQTPIRYVMLAAPVSRQVCKRLSELFEAEVVAGTGVDCLVFPERFADYAFSEASRRSHDFDPERARALLPPDTHASFQEEVAKEIQLVFPRAPKIEEIAAALATSKRTLQRRLGEEGQSFRGLCLKTRADIARGFLQVGGTVGEVAELLGYADATAFSRMYRKEMGHPPQRERPLRVAQNVRRGA